MLKGHRKIRKNKIFGVRAMRTSIQLGRRDMARILKARRKKQGLTDGENLE